MAHPRRDNRYNDPALASEVAQKVFITLAKRAVWLAGYPSLGGWIHQTALNLAHAEMRSQQRRHLNGDLAQGVSKGSRKQRNRSKCNPVRINGLLKHRARERRKPSN